MSSNSPQTIRPYANRHLWSDVAPYEVVRVVSPATVEVRPMTATLDPTWQPDMVPGGFAGHTRNNRSQRYTYESDPEAPTIRIRWSKAKRRWQHKGSRYVMSDAPCKFHDYNF